MHDDDACNAMQCNRVYTCMDRYQILFLSKLLTSHGAFVPISRCYIHVNHSAINMTITNSCPLIIFLCFTMPHFLFCDEEVHSGTEANPLPFYFFSLMIMLLISYDDCLVNGGNPLTPGQIIRITYSNTFMYPLAFKSAKFC
ncbi:uncharacterized protein LOC106754015 [Vigna radiata var. radiata]|uniref:Uncharacterized protein LOC106754015 n=1 Tax=Vigna radiata var. radiata TaxID=3916 RepID=A0A1S3TCE2_VIGRR|nr:uncharacterized protein LOC106754015 [Vigna radiata var. radiata]